MTSDTLTRSNGVPPGLRATLEAAVEETGLPMKDLTVLAHQHDPFRLDTPARHRDGKWLADRFAEIDREHIHNRGLHYAVLGATKPNGLPYSNTDKDWLWLSEGASKAARFLGYVPFDKITDERNADPVIREFEPPDPYATISIGGVEVEIPADLQPRPGLEDFRGVQPFKLVLFGEKTSLEDVLAPIAEARQADLYLPTGEASDTMIYHMARTGSEDGRRMVIFYLSDCDPAGWQMAISVGRKLQALKAMQFPDLDYALRPVALTPEQVAEYGLPSTPLKPKEKRAGKWRRAYGIEQTEIDSLATLNPDLLHKIVMDATRPFFDTSLDARVREVRREWEAEALATLEAEIGAEGLANLRAEAEDRLAELETQVAALDAALHVEEVEGIELPEVPEVLIGEPGEVDGLPLLDSNWSYAEQTERLIRHRAYEEA